MMHHLLIHLQAIVHLIVIQPQLLAELLEEHLVLLLG